MRHLVIFTVFIIICCMLAIYCTRNNNGIVTLEGYEHGVAFCSNEFKFAIHAIDSHSWADETAIYVINKGHDKDPQVKELVKLATTHCSQF